MTTPDKILVYLIASQATTDALAEHVRIPMLAVRAMCERHEIDGLLEHAKIADTLTVWRLTYNGSVIATELETAGAGNKPGTAHAAR